MKKRIGLLVACIFSVVLCCNIIVGCSDAPKEKPHITVPSASVRIDRKTESVNVFDGVAAVDMNGKDITDRITVTCSDGEMHLEGGNATFAECGDFTLVYSVSDDYGQKATAEKTVSVRDFYSIYLTTATVPALYGALDVVSNEYPFVFFNDRATVDVSNYGERVLLSGSTEDDYDRAVEKFLELYRQNSYGYFRLFITDACNHMLLRVVVGNDIAEDRYEVKYLSEGTKSYDSAFAFPYRDEGAYEKWQENVDLYEHMVELAENKQALSYNGVTLGNHLTDGLSACYLYAASKPNAEFWGAYPEALYSKSERVRMEIDKAHAIKKQPYEMYKVLTTEQKNKFLQSALQAVEIDKDILHDDYFNEEGPYLIIAGANFVNSTLKQAFLDVLTEICEDYSGYNILFKPHPRSIPSETVHPEIYNRMNEHDIKILPGVLPIEVITWMYDSALVGGFDGSLYMSVPQGNTAFFIAKDKMVLEPVSRLLYESGAFGSVDDIKFYWPQESV